MLPSDDSDDEDTAEDDESEVMIAAGKKNEQRSLIAHYGRELIRSAAQLAAASGAAIHFKELLESGQSMETQSRYQPQAGTRNSNRHRRDPPCACDIHIHIHSHSHS